MATIEKEKAIDVVKQMVADGQVSQEVAEKYFPELKESKESEEERIRKDIISYLKSSTAISPKTWIAWLEKQKVLATEEDLQGKEDVLWCIKQAKKYAKDENEMGTCWFAEKWLEKQGKQGERKPTTEIKSAEESLGIDSETYNKIVDECIYGEQKPAETEKGAKGNEREIPFSEQKWSEEDEIMLEAAISSINHESVIEGLRNRGVSYCIDSSAHLMKDLIDWLKSLRPQNKWKPSDEQMKALDDVISSKDIKYDVLSELYKDLKKLREE